MAAHHDAHGHHHGHGHGHAATDAQIGRAFVLGIALNLIFVIIEAGAGLVSGSMSLIADAGHNLSDVAALAVAGVAYLLARRRPSRRFTYGLQGSSILASLGNAILLMIACGAIGLEAIRRLTDPPPVAGTLVMMVAAIGIIINLGTALLFAKGRKDDLNVRGAFLHMAADAAISLGVVIAGGLVWITGAAWLDPAMSLLIVAVIVVTTWGLLRESLELALNAVPQGIDPEAVTEALAALDGVTSVHHLHIWPMSTTAAALTAHLVMPGGHPGDAFLNRASHLLDTRFQIRHATFQVETGAECADGDCG